jgi:ribosomal protein S18 acetylase RimI-like enzyme
MTNHTFRIATREDIPAIVALLADDGLGRGRENAADLVPYEAAHTAMQSQPGNDYVLAIGEGGSVLGCLQFTLIHGLSRGGTLRAQIEGVRVSGTARGQGIGEKLFRHAIERARSEGATLVQLTSDLQRNDAIRFYERLGFVHSHAGMKLTL